MPQRGRIALFNRSYYEEVLVVRVHPEYLDAQQLPEHQIKDGTDKLWESRYHEINTMEQWWTNNNMLVLKFFLHVSKEEQKKRFLERIDDHEKHWSSTRATSANGGTGTSTCAPTSKCSPRRAQARAVVRDPGGQEMVRPRGRGGCDHEADQRAEVGVSENQRGRKGEAGGIAGEFDERKVSAF